jgi:perosamine synthetase
MAISAHERHACPTVVVESYEEVGFNYRMTDLQAAVGIVQLGKLDAMVAERRSLADRYRDALGDLPSVFLPADPPYGTTNYQSYVVRLSDELPLERDALMQQLLDQGIATRRGIMAAHLEPACRDLPARELPVTERLTRRSLILPLFHGMDIAEVAWVAGSLAHCVQEVSTWR